MLAKRKQKVVFNRKLFCYHQNPTAYCLSHNLYLQNFHHNSWKTFRVTDADRQTNDGKNMSSLAEV